MREYKPIEKEIFHVHTYRCKHAGDIQDYEYIEKAIAMGANRIVFTDHAPFPGNRFRNRMSMEELEEYVTTLKELQEKYVDQIDVRIGLEVEYLPSYLECFKMWKKTKQFDLLMIGQHFSEIKPGEYSFSLDREELNEREAKVCGQAIVEGIQTGCFSVVAHPDRIFRRRREWTTDMETISREIIQQAVKCNVYLEKNEASKRKSYQYWKEFWQIAEKENAKIIVGYDIHSLEEMDVLNGYVEE